MEIGIIICTNCLGLSDDNEKYVITFIASLSVALIIFFANVFWDRAKRKKETREKLRREIFLICEKLIRYAIHASQRALEAKYFYSMHKADRDEDFDKVNYSKYLNDCESSSLATTLYHAELVSKIMELENIWNNDVEIKNIKHLMFEEGYTIIKTFDGIFNEKMSKEQIEAIRNSEMSSIEIYVTNKSIGKNIVEIQNIIYPKARRI